MKKNLFPKNLYAYKFAYRLENNDLAERLDSTPQTIGRWINDERTPPKATLRGIAALMGVTPEQLETEDLTLRFLHESGFLQLGVGNMAAEPNPEYGGAPNNQILKHLESIQKTLKKLMDDNRRMMDSMRTPLNGMV